MAGLDCSALLAPREPLANARRSSGRADDVPPPPPPPEPGDGVSRVPLTGGDTGIVGSAAGGPTGGSSPPKTASTPLSHRLRSSCSFFHCRAVSRRCCSLRASSLSSRAPVATSRSRAASSVASPAATAALLRNSCEKWPRKSVSAVDFHEARDPVWPSITPAAASHSDASRSAAP